MTILDRLYGSIIDVRNALYDRGILKVRKLCRPVISVGNISAGGSGKTPFVIMLGELLAHEGLSIDVLSRGYRRSTRGVLQVNAAGTSEQFGDEPLLIARKLGCPVFVGADRYSAGVLAERQHTSNQGAAIHLLDDGFQHRRLHRDFDIVLLNREDLEDRLLPTGRLRERVSSLSRADAVVIEHEFPIELLPSGNFQIWHAQRRVEVPELNAPVIAFCGIARPQHFFSTLRASGLDVREEIVFRDHHRYTKADVKRLAASQMRIPSSSLVTTEKDAINLGEYAATFNPTVIPMSMGLVDPNSALTHLLTMISGRSS